MMKDTKTVMTQCLSRSLCHSLSLGLYAFLKLYYLLLLTNLTFNSVIPTVMHQELALFLRRLFRFLPSVDNEISLLYTNEY